VELNPGYATAHQWYSLLLAEDGRDAEATRHAQEAVTLDPLSGTLHQTLGLVHYYGRRYDRAEAEARRALELSPHLQLARHVQARALLLQGKSNAVIQLLEPAAASYDADTLMTLGGGAPA
jgi:Flp pilus assembly protein TadD